MWLLRMRAQGRESVRWWKALRGREIQSQAEGSPASFAEGQTGMVKHGLTFLLQCVRYRVDQLPSAFDETED